MRKFYRVVLEVYRMVFEFYRMAFEFYCMVFEFYCVVKRFYYGCSRNRTPFLCVPERFSEELRGERTEG